MQLWCGLRLPVLGPAGLGLPSQPLRGRGPSARLRGTAGSLAVGRMRYNKVYAGQRRELFGLLLPPAYRWQNYFWNSRSPELNFCISADPGFFFRISPVDFRNPV
jgi:hypothetical protein